MRLLLSLCLFGALPLRAAVLEDRVVLASHIAHVAIIEAQSKDALFFQRCEFFRNSGEAHSTKVHADHLFNCEPLGPMLPNTKAVRDFLESSFTDALNLGLKELDETGYALPVTRDGLIGAAIVGGVVFGLETLLGRGTLRGRALVAGGFGTIGGAMVFGFKSWQARQAQYEEKRSQQIQKVIDLTIPPEPQLIDEKATSRAEAIAVMHLFTRALQSAAELTRANAATLVSEPPDGSPADTPPAPPGAASTGKN